MKSTLLFSLFLFTATSMMAQGGYLPNSSFENWTNTMIYENPDSWSSSNYREFGNIVNVTQSTDAQHLTSSVVLQTVLSGSDTAFAYTFLGVVGQQGPDGGIPYSTSVDRLNGYYKGTILPNDTAMVLAIKYLAGNIVAMDFYPIFLSQSNWTAFTMNLTPVAQDSIFVGMISSNPFVTPIFAKPGTTIMFDNISLSHSVNGAGPALPNYSFETWTPVSIDDPDNWTTLNGYFSSVGLAPVTETTDANTGSSAAQIETLAYGSDTIPGMLFYADFNLNNGQVIPIPYTASPLQLNGSYKYAPVGMDGAFVSMEFYNNGVVVGGNNAPLNATSTYQTFSIPTNISSAPDSIALAFFAGSIPGSVLIVDDIQFSGGDLSTDNLAADFSFETYPNPATDYLTITSPQNATNLIVIITDMNGKQILSQSDFSNQQTLDISALSTGMYYVTLKNSHKAITKPFAVVK